MTSWAKAILSNQAYAGNAALSVMPYVTRLFTHCAIKLGFNTYVSYDIPMHNSSQKPLFLKVERKKQLLT